MIPQEIKDRLQLTPTGIHNAKSFVNNCEIMFSKVLQCYVADCDLDGEKLDDKYLLYNRGKGRWGCFQVTHEFAEKIPVEIFANIAKEKLSVLEPLS